MNLRYALLAGSGIMALNLIPVTALAQAQGQTTSAGDTSADEAETSRASDTIVVTGTLIRGVEAPMERSASMNSRFESARVSV